MAVLPILRWPDPRLSQPCGPIEGDVTALVADMFDTMYAAPGRGLAAPQVGVMQRLFVMDTTWKEGARTPKVFLDPQIIAHATSLATGSEGCLSIPGVVVDVTRPSEVTVAWTDVDGQAWEQTFDGFEAVCIQHEIDHLNGKVVFDRLDPAARERAEAEFSGRAQ